MSENLPAVARQARQGHADAIDRPEPQPGTYWRAKADVPGRSRKETHQHSDYWSRQREEVRLYHKDVVEREPMAAGSMVLLRHVGKVDGHAHTLVTSPDPSIRGDTARTWLLDDFEEWLEPVDAAEAGAERSGQVQATLRRIDGIRQEMAAIASGVSQDQASLPAPGMVAAGATPAVLGEARERAKEARNALQVRSEDMKALNVRLVDNTRELVDLQTEHANAAVAAVQDALDAATAAAKAAETMDLFGGTKVEVIEVLGGEGAPAGTPVTLYQNLLFLDEELAVHLHQKGFDSSNFGELGDIFARTPGLLDRIAGAPRAVVLVRIRRKGKPLDRDAGIHEFFRSLEMAQADREQFLLLRDGERVAFVFSETAMQDAARLFPTLDEMDRPFRGAGGADMITVKDARFTEARSEFERQSLVYKRLLVLLWGLEFDERRPLGAIEADGRPGNWQDPEWQARNCVFVADDATRSLPDARPPILEYLARNAELLQPGSRVLVHWRRVINPDTAPTITQRYGDPYDDKFHVTHWPEADYSVHLVREREGWGLVVDVQVTRPQHGRGRPSFKTGVDLAQYGGETGFLVLDGIEDEDLSHYVESRESRRHYLEYLALFRHARKALAETFAEVRAIDARMASDLSGDLPGHPADAVRKAVRDAHRMWRSLNSGKTVTPRAERKVRDAAFMVLAGTPTIEAIREIAGVEPGDVLLAGIDGAARIEVMVPARFDPLVADTCWVERRRFSQDAKGAWKPDGVTEGRVHRLAEPSLAIRARSERLERFVKGSFLPAGFANRAETDAVVEALSRVSPDAIRRAHMDDSRPGLLVDGWNATTRRLTFGKRTGGAYERKGVLEGHDVTVVAAVVRLDSGWHGKGPNVGYLCLSSDPLARAFHADPGQRRRAERYAADIWKHGGKERIEAAAKRAEAMARAAAEGRLAHDLLICNEGDEMSAVIRAEGAACVERTGRPHSINWKRESSQGHPDDWSDFRSRFGLRDTRKDAVVGRIVARRDVWDWFVGQTGWPAEIPADIAFHEIEPAV